MNSMCFLAAAEYAIRYRINIHCKCLTHFNLNYSHVNEGLFLQANGKMSERGEGTSEREHGVSQEAKPVGKDKGRDKQMDKHNSNHSIRSKV